MDTGNALIYLEAQKAGKCFNRYDDLRCDIFAKRGDCKTNSGFMSGQCSKSCGLCVSNETGFVVPTIPCQNYINDERCDALAKEVSKNLIK